MGSGCVHDHFNPRHNLKCDKFIFQMMQIIWGHFGERDFQTSGFDSACLSITMTHSAERLALSHGASDSLLSAQAGGRWDSMRHRKSRGWAERMSWNYVSRGTLCFLIFILNVLSFYFGFCIFIQVQAGDQRILSIIHWLFVSLSTSILIIIMINFVCSMSDLYIRVFLFLSGCIMAVICCFQLTLISSQ